MKKLILIIAILVSIGGIFWITNRQSQTSFTRPDAQEPTPSPTYGAIHKTQIGEFMAAYTDQFSGDQVSLHPNFTEQLNSKKLFTDNSCKVLVNGGFYSKENKPIGLFISDYKQSGNHQNNSLFDGILSINDMATPRITSSVPQDRLRLALQTGPILIGNSFLHKLSIKNDSPDRRTVAAITGENKIFFLTIYDPQSMFSGPNLEELPKVLEEFQKQTGIQIADAINMDGGTASALQSSEVGLSEINPIGSFFCIKP